MLVDLHVQSGSCITDRTESQSLAVCSAVCSENQLHESCNGTILEHVVEDGEVAAFPFIQTGISHINTLHNCCGSRCSPNPEILSCAWGSQLASWAEEQKRNAFDMSLSSWWRHHVFVLEGEYPAISCWEAKTGLADPPPVLLSYITEMQVIDFEKRLIHKNLSGLSILIICLHNNSQIWWLLDKVYLGLYIFLGWDVIHTHTVLFLVFQQLVGVYCTACGPKPLGKWAQCSFACRFN